MARRTRRAVKPDDEQVQAEGPFAGRDGETVFLRGEGGAVSPRTLPLAEPELDLLAAGRLTEVEEAHEVTDADTGAVRWVAGPEPKKARSRKPAAEPDAELVALAEAGLDGVSAEDITALAEASLEALADAGITEGTTAEDLQALAKAAQPEPAGGKARS